MIRDIWDAVDQDDGYRPQWTPCERCSGRMRLAKDEEALRQVGVLLACEDCGRRVLVVDNP